MNNKPTNPINDVINKATEYWTHSGGTSLAHFQAGTNAEKRHMQIGLPNVAITAIVATSVFSTYSTRNTIKNYENN